MNFTLPAELAAWQQRVRQFVRQELQPHDAAIEASGEVPAAAMVGLRRMGLFGTNTPTAYGGLGLSMLGSCLAVEELAKAHVAFYYLSGVNVHIGSKPIEFAGSEALKRRWLPELASGRTIAAFALTEADAGSDAARIRTTARRDGLAYYVLDGAKTYITNAPQAGLFTVFATLDPSLGAKGMAAFVVEAGTPGLKVGRTVEMAAGRGSSHAELVLESCRVPAENLLGDVGRGFEIAMRSLDAGRTHWAPIASAPPSGCSISRWRARPRARPSATACASTRASNGCWPTWPPPCMPPASSPTRRRGATITAVPASALRPPRCRS